MLASDTAHFQAFVNWANQQRAIGLPIGIDLREVSAILGPDSKRTTLTFSTAITDSQGNALPPDWIVSTAT